MKSLAAIRLVAGREFRERARTKGFRIALILSVVLVAVAVALPGLLAGGEKPTRVGLTSSAPASLADAVRAGGAATGEKLTVRAFPTASAGESALRDGKLDVLVVPHGDGATLTWKDSKNDALEALVAGALQTAAVRDRAVQAGLSADEASGLLAPVEVTNHVLKPKHNQGNALGTAIAMVVILFVAVSVYGGLVLGGVVEEKSSRVVELLLVRISPRDLLTGKIVGIGLLGLLQFIAIAVVAYVAMLGVNSAHAPTLTAASLAWAVVWFLLGYSFYSVVYGSLGAMASRMEDAQGAATPVTALLLIAYFFTFTAIDTPDGVVAQVGSYLPFSAPLVMPIRIALDAAAWWEIAASLAVTVVTVYGLVQLAGRLYTGAVLRLGRRVKLREAWAGTKQ